MARPRVAHRGQQSIPAYGTYQTQYTRIEISEKLEADRERKTTVACFLWPSTPSQPGCNYKFISSVRLWQAQLQLFEIGNDVSGNDIAGPALADKEDTSPAALSECLKAFFGLILGSEGSLPEFEQMQVPSLWSEACVQVARSLTDAYELIYKAIMDPRNRYPDPKSLARHPPDQIRTILGI